MISDKREKGKKGGKEGDRETGRERGRGGEWREGERIKCNNF